MSFLAELKRRRVWRVAAAYLIVAWATIQVSETVAPRIGLPDWTTTLVIFLAAIGLPVVLVLAWMFDIGRDGIQRTEADPAGGSPVRYIALALVVLIAGTTGFVGWKRYGNAGGDSLDSIAVLAFANMSGDAAQEPFADGVSEEILNALAQVEGLSVAARTSAFAFKNKNEDVTEIARKLRVATVLEGSVRKSGDKLRITAQLIKASDGYHLWSETYDRDATDIFAVQDEIARTIVAKLRIKLAANAGPEVRRGGTSSLTAHELYLLGLHHFAKRRPEDFKRAIEVFEQAIAEDSTYALAWGGLALTYAAAPFYLDIPLKETARLGRAAANRALAIDSTVAEAYAALGDMLLHVDYDLRGSERLLRRAVALKPSYVQAYDWLSEPLGSTGQLAEALLVSRRAVELDPLAMRPRTTHAYILNKAGFADSALVHLAAAMQIDSTHPTVLINRVDAYFGAGRTADAALAIRRYAATDKPNQPVFDLAAQALLDPALREPALRGLQRITAGSTPYSRGLVLTLFVKLGDHQRALDFIEKLYAIHDVGLPFVFWDRVNAPLRGEPRFRAVAQKLGITPPPR